MRQVTPIRMAVRIEAVVACVLGFSILFGVHRSLSWHARIVDERYFASPVIIAAIALALLIATDLLLWGATFAGTAVIGTRTALLDGPLRIVIGFLAATLARVPFVTSDVTPPPARLVTVYARVLTSDITFLVAVVLATLVVVTTFLFARRSQAGT